jgi:hypothetical protein
MAAGSIRSTVTRFVVVTGLAAALFAGSFALVQPSHASAAKYTCEEAIKWVNMLRAHAYHYGTLWEATGNPQYLAQAAYYQGSADAYEDAYCL